MAIPRLLMQLTSTLNGNGHTALPPATILGKDAYSLNFMGHGSARVFSNPIDPKIIDGLPYIMLDMGQDPIRFPQIKEGLQQLYGKNILIDRRRLVGFVREISLVSEQEYQQRQAPSVLNTFPKDLDNPNLEYAGLYEDGWLSENVFFILSQPPTTTKLLIQGMLPEIGTSHGPSELTVRLDGHVFRKHLKPGAFTVDIPVALNQQRHRVELHFNGAQQLPLGDDRPVSAKLLMIGFAK